MKSAKDNLLDNSSDQESSSEEENNDDASDAGEEEEEEGEEAENESDFSESEKEEGNVVKKATAQNGNMKEKITTESKAETSGVNVAAVIAVNKNKNSKGPPTTKNMVEFALKSLNDREGSSVRAIIKFIKANFAVEERKRLNFSIKNYLKKALAAGTVEQSKGSNMAGSFKLAAKNADKNQKTRKVKAKNVKEKDKIKATISTPATSGTGKTTKVQKKKPANAAAETDIAKPSKKAKLTKAVEPVIGANSTQIAIKTTKNKSAKRKSIGTLINISPLAAITRKTRGMIVSMKTINKASKENVDTNNVGAADGAVPKKRARKAKK